MEPLFVWKGEGDAAFLSEYGTEGIDFEFELSVDQQGMFEGQTSNEDGVSKIKHLFYSEKKQYDYPGFFTRNIVIVLLLNEYGNDPMLSILNGRLLMDKFFYGEVMLARYEAGSDTAKALGVGASEATLMDDDELPYEVKSALKKCLPIGAVKIEGDYKEEATSAAAGGDATSGVPPRREGMRRREGHHGAPRPTAGAYPPLATRHHAPPHARHTPPRAG